MGNELSTETSDEHMARWDADYQAQVNKAYPEWLRYYQEKKALKRKRLSETQARDGEADNQALNEMKSTHDTPTGTTPKLVRSSKSEAIRTSLPPMPLTNDDSDEESTDLLSQWKPRKGRKGRAGSAMIRTNNDSQMIDSSRGGVTADINNHDATTAPQDAEASGHEAFVGFGNQVSTQEAGISPFRGDSFEQATDGAMASGDSREISSNDEHSTARSHEGSGGIERNATPSKRSSTTTQTAQLGQPVSSIQPDAPPRSVGDAPIEVPPDDRSKKNKALMPSLSSIGTFRRPKPAAASLTPGPSSSAIQPHEQGEGEGAAITSITERPPRWYKDLPKVNTRNKADVNADVLMRALKDEIRARHSNRSPQLLVIRTALHRITFEPVSGPLLRRNRMLDNQDGLPQLFDPQYSNGVTWPFDIRADAEELYNKWCRKIFETDLMRGIVQQPVKKSASGKTIQSGHAASFDPDKAGDRVSSKYYGNGLLLNGQWWPMQLAVVRDGAHGETQGGISGPRGGPAYSCIMSGGEGYDEDQDNGDTVFYCGTDRVDGQREPSEGTKCLIQNHEKKQPVRFIRSYKIKHGGHQPVAGFRYDGLYNVESYKKVDPPSSTRQRHVFSLKRTAGQDPIRSSGPEKRPTDEEIKAWNNDRKNRGFPA